MDQCPLPSKDPTGGLIIITSPYGPRGGRLHAGADLGSSDGIEIGTAIGPPTSGKVVRFSDDGPFRPPNGHTAGRNLWFMGDDGSRWKMFHLNRLVVSIDQHVTLADQIAEVGNSGTQAAHLHLEKHSGGWSNPVDFNAELRSVMTQGRFFRTSLPVTPPVPPAGKDWLEMATKEEVEELVRRITQEEILNQDARIKATITAPLNAVLTQIDPAGVAAGKATTPSEPYLRQLVEGIHNKVNE